MGMAQNNWVKVLLSWHGHDRGGVHVPFQDVGPIGNTPIETGLIRRLRELAGQIAASTPEAPRWIFLVGGPGNGKSETVQAFLLALDQELQMGGALVDRLRSEFSPRPLVKRRVEIDATGFEPGTQFAGKVRRLIVVQDATATDDAFGNSASQLVLDVMDLMTSDPATPPVFVMCSNRGLLARALKEAQINQEGDEVVAFLEQLIKASSLGVQTLVPDEKRPSCWPLQGWPQAACWPLDLGSLIVPSENRAAPFEQILEYAVSAGNWDSVCKDCDSRAVCPFLQNSIWLRDDENRRGLLEVLRRGELFLAQRWNFRDSFSLIAELLVGQWTDIASEHPCLWVHAQRECLEDPNPARTIAPSLALARRLYPHALFPGTSVAASCDIPDQLRQSHPITAAIDDAWNNIEEGSTKSIRERITQDYSRLDPALAAPEDDDHPLRLIENDYSQSIRQGNTRLSVYGLSEAEMRVLACLESAEAEWAAEFMGRNSTVVIRVISYLKRLAAFFVKRSIGTRLGFHAHQGYLEAYERDMHNTMKLRAATPYLQRLLGDDKFRFNALQSFGQPHAEEKRGSQEVPISLVANIPRIMVHPAPTGNNTMPGHDMPFFTIGDDDYPVPLTFDFYLALQLRQAGCASSSLPASVRAAVDKVKQRFAGTLCRNSEDFLGRTAAMRVIGGFTVGLNDASAPPLLEKGED